MGISLSQGSGFQLGQGFSFFDFFISIFDGAGHSEPLSKDGVEHNLVVGSPLAAVFGESSNRSLDVFFQVRLEVS